MKEFVCIQCGCVFTHNRNNRKFCGYACSNKSRARYADLTKAEYDKLYRNREHIRGCRKSAVATRLSKLGGTYKVAMLNRAKLRADQKGIPFNIDVSDIEIPDICPVLGVKLEYAPDSRGGKSNSPSLDKIIPELGYVKGNVMVMSKRANSIKTDASFEEIEKVYLFMKAHFQDTQGMPLKVLKAKYPEGITK